MPKILQINKLCNDSAGSKILYKHLSKGKLVAITFLNLLTLVA